MVRRLINLGRKSQKKFLLLYDLNTYLNYVLLMQTRSKICVVSFEKVSGFLLFPILCREVTCGFPLINYVFLKGSAIDLSCCKISLTLEYPIKAHVIFL